MVLFARPVSIQESALFIMTDSYNYNNSLERYFTLRDKEKLHKITPAEKEEMVMHVHDILFHEYPSLTREERLSMARAMLGQKKKEGEA